MSSGLKFELKPVKEIPRGYRKSKYDLIINEFIGSGEKLVSVDVEGKSVNYVRSQLGKRIELRGLTIGGLSNMVWHLILARHLFWEVVWLPFPTGPSARGSSLWPVYPQ